MHTYKHIHSAVVVNVQCRCHLGGGGWKCTDLLFSVCPLVLLITERGVWRSPFIHYKNIHTSVFSMISLKCKLIWHTHMHCQVLYLICLFSLCNLDDQSLASVKDLTRFLYNGSFPLVLNLKSVFPPQLQFCWAAHFRAGCIQAVRRWQSASQRMLEGFTGNRQGELGA